MSYPGVQYGVSGDEKVAQSTKIGNLPLGTRLILEDGRIFAHAKVSATAGVAGKLYKQAVLVGDHGNIAGSGVIIRTAVAVGDTAIVLTANTVTAVTKDQYAEGYMTVCTGTAGIGYTYKIKSHAAAASAGAVALTINLEQNDKVAATVAAGTTAVSLRKNPFDSITIAASAVPGGVPAGVLPVAVSAGFYCWVQRRGTCAGLAGATTIATGFGVVASTTVDGAFIPQSAAGSAIADYPVLGIAQNTVTAADYGNIYLMLE